MRAKPATLAAPPALAIKQDTCSLPLVVGVGYCFLKLHIQRLEFLKDGKTDDSASQSYDSPASNPVFLTPFEPWIKTLQGFVYLKDDLYSSRIKGSVSLNNCKSLPQSTQPHPPPGLTSHLPTSNTKRHMLDFLPCSCCYLSPGCLPLASSHLLKLNSAHFFLEVSMTLPHKHNWTTSPFPGTVEDQSLSHT